MQPQPNPVTTRHILIVDDDQQLAQAFKELLQAHDYRASTAANGLQALKMVMNIEVDAILCDLTMPELPGDMLYAAIERVRPRLKRRFIFVTGHSTDAQYEPFLKQAQAPVLRKPVSEGLLLAELDRFFAKPPA